MGRVYKARQTSLARLVALKVLNPLFAEDEELTLRFLREARAGARLSHPNAVRMLDQGTCPNSGTHYIAFEYVDGATLEELLRKRGKMPEPVALSLIQGVLAALVAAEEAGIVHRDIKPDNVLVTREGTAKLLDLGLAKRVGEAGLTVVGAVLGTPHYVAPEQVLGLDDVDIRADLYAVGLSLWRCLTGQFPFQGEEFIEIATRHVNEDVPDPRELEPEISGYTAQFLTWICARDPEDRYPSARAAHLEISRILEDAEPLGPAEAQAEASSIRRLAKQQGQADVAAWVAGRRVSQNARRPQNQASPATLSDTTVTFPFSLRLMTGDVVLQEKRFNQDVVTIGRARGADFHIDNPVVSRNHAELRRSKDSFALAPKSTTNPTTVNGRRVKDLVPIVPGDKIVLADKFRLVLHLEQAEEQPVAIDDTKTEARRFIPTPAPGRTPAPSRSAPEVVEDEELEEDNPYAQPTLLPDEVEEAEDGGATDVGPVEPAPTPTPTPAPREEPTSRVPVADLPTQPIKRGLLKRLRAEEPAPAAQAPPAASAAPDARIRFPRDGKSLTLPVQSAAPLQIGKEQGCEVRISGPFAPRKAALIVWCGTAYRVFNVGPSPDTVTLNGAEVPDQAPLGSGDHLRVYGLELTFEV